MLALVARPSLGHAGGGSFVRRHRLRCFNWRENRYFKRLIKDLARLHRVLTYRVEKALIRHPLWLIEERGRLIAENPERKILIELHRLRKLL